ncbi:MAG TPA: 5'/3'-nucleotidase SurE [Bacteroidales bacterium]|jgi:5'-nucleotidase|nr:5'/3'-nucleotidase SurE [Bacteroidales bacterium]MDI9573639.1 5'/3'-nucleotidase SurE [Bacteroidota bacterium]OQC62007.1 MAG: 5'-nucleotidase SurE [Bacteroidetes bacterium ADurb.Bin012]MBP9511031.1 5'/3'-nucleotidase SurE [Bacteroidales bacterium]MBP9587732.1 5'/3'-nucleotidase SurE [Bacteroidales bacterium]
MDNKLILVTNDDGVNAPGIKALIRMMRPMGHVIVAAPDKPQSGMAHSITVNIPLRYQKISEEENYEEYGISGTPVDCVKLAEKFLVPRKPDLLVSGINHGSNASINILYSGTMAAVLEGCMLDIPSIGFSFCDYSYHANFSCLDEWVTRIARIILENGLPRGVCLNVNIPETGGEPIRGIHITHQGEGRWEEEFDHRLDPRERDYFWIMGNFINYDGQPGSDLCALENNFISVMPVQYDMTAHYALDYLKKIFNNE